MADWSSGTCPRASECAFYQSVTSSPLMRVKYATMYPYCKKGKHEECLRWKLREQGAAVADDLLPDGGRDGFAIQTRSVEPGTKKIIVVDDIPLFRKSLVTLATNASGGENIRVFEAGSGEEALEMMLADPDGWIMLITDHNMPEMSGYDLIVKSRLHPSLSRIPAIVFSSEMQEGIKTRCMALPRVRWLEKRPNQELFDEAWRELANAEVL